MQELVQDLPLPPERLRVLGIQDAGGTREAIQQGIEHVAALLAVAAQDVRTPVAARHLWWACSAAARTAIRASAPTRRWAQWWTCWCSRAARPCSRDARDLRRRTPADRAPPAPGGRAPARAHPLVGRPHTAQHGGDMNNNPSPGNKAGGITTILEKSLGAVAKGGQTGLMEVLAYAQQPSQQASSSWTRRAMTCVSATGQVRGRRQPHLLHHRPRLHLRLQAHALTQDRHPHGHLPAHVARHGLQRRWHR